MPRRKKVDIVDDLPDEEVPQEPEEVSTDEKETDIELKKVRYPVDDALVSRLRESGRVLLTRTSSQSVRRVLTPIGDTLVCVAPGMVKIMGIRTADGSPLMLQTGEAIYLPHYLTDNDQMRQFLGSEEMRVLFESGAIRIVRAVDLKALEIPDYAEKISGLAKYFGGREGVSYGGIGVLPEKVFGMNPGDEFIKALERHLERLSEQGVEVETRSPQV